MSIEHKIGVVYRTQAGTITDITQTITGDSEAALDYTVAPAQTNHLTPFALLAADIKAIMFTCDRAVTIKTNSSSSPDNTIVLAAGKQLVWVFGDAATCPITVDVTKLYITNSGGNSALVRIRAITDPA